MQLERPTTAGLTLIESIIYIALFGLIISAGLSATYNLITGTEDLDEIAMTQVEAHFILHKIQHEIESVATGTVNLTNELELVDIDGATTTFSFNNASETIGIIRDGGDIIPLHTDRVNVQHVSFLVIATRPQAVEVDMTINDTVFNDVRYYMTR